MVICALSVKVSFPVSVVPLGLVSVVGLNVTETWQLEFAGTEPSQLFAAMTYGPLVAIDVKVTGTTLELVSVTVLAARWYLPGLSRTTGSRRHGGSHDVAHSDTVIDCVGMYASSVTTIVPVSDPGLRRSENHAEGASAGGGDLAFRCSCHWLW